MTDHITLLAAAAVLTGADAQYRLCGRAQHSEHDEGNHLVERAGIQNSGGSCPAPPEHLLSMPRSQTSIWLRRDGRGWASPQYTMLDTASLPVTM